MRRLLRGYDDPVRAVLALLCVGAGLIWMGLDGCAEHVGGEVEPVVLSAERLVTAGHGGNPHVRVTDVLLLASHIVVARTERDERAGYQAGELRGGTVWSSAWLPAVPRSTPEAQQWLAEFEAGGDPAPPEVRLLVRTGRGERGKLALRTKQTEVQGLIVNGVEPLPDDVRRILAESYPRADLSRALILEEGRAPTPSPLQPSLWIAGVLALAGAAGWAVWLHRERRHAQRTEQLLAGRRIERMRTRARRRRAP